MLSLMQGGCAHRIGSGLTAGVLEEMGGDGRSEGIDGTAQALLEKALLVELGHQLGQGLSSGATTITEEQRLGLESSISSILDVTAKRAGKGIRNEVSPELRRMVTQDLVLALSQGLRGELGDSLEDTVDRVVAQAIYSLRDNLSEDATQIVLSDLLRDSIYFAMQEGRFTPGVGETIEQTLQENMLTPVESTVDNMASGIALRVNEANEKTERTLQGVITALVIGIGVMFMLWMITQRQNRRLREKSASAEQGRRNFDAALDQLDPSSREAVIAKLREYERVEGLQAGALTPAPPPARSNNYER